MNWQLSGIQRAIGGVLSGRDQAIAGVSTDTRGIGAGQLFVALRGERFDGHDFLEQAVAAGAGALLVAEGARIPVGTSALVVPDTRLALGRMAAAWRARFEIPVIAVTGSNGKTTTKEMIAAILRSEFGDAVLVTRGNLNNDIGLPLTLLGLDPSHRAAVIEMGMSHPGEIAYLAPLGAPTVAVVTNAQRAHLEGMGDMNEVAREKGSIFAGLADGGVAVVNADDAYADLWRMMAGSHLLRTFGIEHAAVVRAGVRQQGLTTRLSLQAPEGRAELKLAVPGRHNAR
ncbi:MAG: Mur ligase family protein, partial [Candidatus Dechloromonas phosphoritropha]